MSVQDGLLGIKPVTGILAVNTIQKCHWFCKVEVSHFPVEAGLECGRGIGDHERARANLCGSIELGYARPDDGCDGGECFTIAYFAEPGH